MADRLSIEGNLANHKNALATLTIGTTQHIDMQNGIKSIQKELDEITSGLDIIIPEYLVFSTLIDKKTALVKYFKASRMSAITHTHSAVGLASDKEQQNQISTNSDNNFGTNLEQHLVNLKTRRSLAISENIDTEIAENIRQWFIHFDQNLQQLMEDPSAKLSFDSEHLKFSIHQDGKPPYTFQTLSSGYSAIFDIYSDLLMRTEYFKVTPKEIKGVVFIDEIDAHLHPSLQRLILPFFQNSFPNIQFITSTHSPFVLTSVEGDIVYNLGTSEQIDEDIWFYSHEAIIKGLLKVDPTSPILSNLILKISELIKVNEKEIDYEQLSSLLHKVKPFENKLDSRSSAFYLKAKIALQDR